MRIAKQPMVCLAKTFSRRNDRAYLCLRNGVRDEDGAAARPRPNLVRDFNVDSSLRCFTRHTECAFYVREGSFSEASHVDVRTMTGAARQEPRRALPTNSLLPRTPSGAVTSIRYGYLVSLFCRMVSQSNLLNRISSLNSPPISTVSFLDS